MDGDVILEISEFWDKFPFYRFIPPGNGTLDILLVFSGNYVGEYNRQVEYQSDIIGDTPDAEKGGLGGALVPVGLLSASPLFGKGVNLIRRRRNNGIGADLGSL